MYNTDITQLKPPSLNNMVDGIIAGPPCQGFSLSGNRDRNDPRNSLFMEFIRFLKYYHPKFFVMENVLGILSMKTKDNDLVKDIILDEQTKLGYNVGLVKLNSADYGVPQKRNRVFFIGIREDYKFNEKLLTPPRIISNEKDYLTVCDAISDLPIIHAREGTEIQEFSKPPLNQYQMYCRRYSNHVYNHISMRHTDRIIERFKHIRQGESVANVDPRYGQKKRGSPTEYSNKTYSQNNYRVYSDKPSPTITASFQSNFIHPVLNRNFTAREGARLQSYPDYYIFKGKRTKMSWEKGLSQYQQIGNSVPPLLAKAIAENIKKSIR